MDDPPAEPKKEDPTIVIAPGGPRPCESVHAVKPGEVIRREESGVYRVVPEAGPSTSERSLPMAEELVLTPGGYRPKSLVHRVEPAHILRLTGNRSLQMVHPSGAIVQDFGIIAARPANVPLMPLNVNRLPRTSCPGAGGARLGHRVDHLCGLDEQHRASRSRASQPTGLSRPLRPRRTARPSFSSTASRTRR